MAKQKREMVAAAQGSGVQFTQTANNQSELEVPSDVSFAVGSAQIQPGFDPTLNCFAQTLTENPSTTVGTVGHINRTGSDAIKQPLSVNRAAAVRT